MAEYAQFHELRTYMKQLDLAGLSSELTFHKNKEQLSKWLKSQMNRDVASDAASMHGMAFCSFEHTAQCPFGHLSCEIRNSIGGAVSRMITHLVLQKESKPDSYGNAFEYVHENAYGLHSYDNDMIAMQDDEVMVAVNSNAPDDFLERCGHCFVATSKHTSPILCVVPKESLAIGIAIFNTSKKMIQIHAGVALKCATKVRIITNEPKSSQFDKIIAVKTIIDKAGLYEKE